MIIKNIMKIRFKVLILNVFLLGLQACVKDKPVKPSTANTTIQSAHQVLVINEGNYGWGNASVSVYDDSNGSIVADYFKSQNNLNLGDVCQSVTKFNGHYYIVINNSGKIIEVNGQDFKQEHVITGFNSPRYILPLSYNKAYVSDLYANSIQVVDLNQHIIIKSIPCSGWTEQMVQWYNKVFVTNIKSNYCYVVDATSDLITDSILVGKGAASLALDQNSKLWILSGGNATDNINGRLLRVDPLSLQVEWSQSFASGESPKNLCFNAARDTLYYLNNGVFLMSIQNTQLPVTPLIQMGNKLFYGLGIHPTNNQIYVSDAIDYVQSSKVMIYSPSGQWMSAFSAGVNANGFVFE